MFRKEGSKAFKQKICCWEEVGDFLICTLKQYGETWGVEVGGYKRGTISAINNNIEACYEIANKQTLNNNPFLYNRYFFLLFCTTLNPPKHVVSVFLSWILIDWVTPRYSIVQIMSYKYTPTILLIPLISPCWKCQIVWKMHHCRMGGGAKGAFQIWWWANQRCSAPKRNQKKKNFGGPHN